MKAIIAGGGTGGHLFPGIAVAREIQRRRPGSEVLFVGSKQGIEVRIVPAEGFPLEVLAVGGIKGIGGMRKLRNMAATLKGIFQARRILARFQPDIVIGVGGYASFPMVGAAILARSPTLIMEQNAVPGLANRILGRWVNCAAVTDARTRSFFGDKAVVTGNPIRPQFKSIAPKIHRPPYTVLVFGGSQGARAINAAVTASLRGLSDWKDRLRFVHQTGETQVEETRRAYAESGFESDVRAFFDAFHERYAEADLIVSRSGATTVAEIKAAGRAAVLIPFPFATDNHQMENARAMVEENAAVLIDNAELTGERMAETIRSLLTDEARLHQIEASARRLAVLDAESRIVDLAEKAMAN